MGISVETLAVAKKYTNRSIEGISGSLAGKNATIESITDITGGHRVTFKWTADNGDVRTQTMDVMDGAKGDKGETGDAGLGIKAVNINAQNHLIITYDDDSTYDAGELPSGGEVISVNGKKGVVTLDANDVGALPDDTSIPSKTSDLTNDSIVDSASYDSTNHQILFKNGTTTLFSLDAAAFVKDGMVDDVEISGGNLVITFNTDAGKQAISIPITDIFDPANYYDKTATDNLLADKADDTSVYKTFSFGNTGSGGGMVKYIELTDAYPNNTAKENSYMITGRNGESAILVLPTGMTIGVYNDPRLLYLTRGTSTPIVSVNLDSTNGKVYVGIGLYTYVHISQIGGERTNWSGKIITELPSGATTVAIVSDVANKADKVASATNGNFAGLDTNGNLTDSGKKASDFATPENVQDSINTSADLLKDTVGWTGKNLLNDDIYFYESGISVNKSGHTFTIETTTVATQYASLMFRPSNNTMYPAGQYKLSLDVSTIGDATARVAIRRSNNSIISAKILSVGANLLEIDTSEDFYISVFPRFEKTNAVTLVFSNPMLRKADITDPTYEPYHESVETMYEEEIHGVNLLKNEAVAKVIYGITFEIGQNGSIGLSGTNTGEGVSTNAIGEVTGLNGTYILNGVNGGSVQTYGIQVHNKTLNSWTSMYCIDGDAAITLESQYTYRFVIYVRNNVAVNTTIKPMLRKADIEDSTYRPYNEQAIQNQLNAQGVLGAKNLLENVGSTVTQSGITATYNSDGSILLNGTATANIGLVVSKDVSNNNFLLNGKYILSGSAVFSDNCYLWINKYVSGSGSSLVQLKTSGEVEFAIDTSQYDGIKVGITIRNGATLSNLLVKPMIRLASDPDDTYQPYAMTNRELTEYNKGFNFLKFLFNADGSDIYSGNLNDLHAGYVYYSNTAVNVPANHYGYCITLERPSLYNYAVQIAINATGDSVNMYVRKKVDHTWGAWKTVTMS